MKRIIFQIQETTMKWYVWVKNETSQFFRKMLLKSNFTCVSFMVHYSSRTGIEIENPSSEIISLHCVSLSLIHENIHNIRPAVYSWILSHSISILSPFHTGLICFRSFQNYAFKGWFSLKTMKLWLLVLTKPLF